MGRRSRRKRERREESAGGQPQSPRPHRAGDGEDRAVTTVIRADHAKGMLIGDHSTQINYFSQVTADGDAVVLPAVQADLPAQSRVFCGRDVHLAELLELLNPEAPATTPKVALVSGMPGVGKSELALHAAHVAARNGWFPGGVLFVTLHGGGLEVAQTALDGFLSAMGIPGDQVPADPLARARLILVTHHAVRRGGQAGLGRDRQRDISRAVRVADARRGQGNGDFTERPCDPRRPPHQASRPGRGRWRRPDCGSARRVAWLRLPRR